MADEDDFTFCQVGLPVGNDETNKVTDSLNGTHIHGGNGNAADRSSNGIGATIWTVSDSSHKQGTVGSLSFTVIDASSCKEEDQQSKQEERQGDAGSSNNATAQTKTPVRKAVPRAKVPYQIGYSPMDWVKLTKTHPDLAGLKGQSHRRLISLNEVKQHQSGNSMWTVLKGHVYNIAPYMKFHPGGEDKLKLAVGKDCTALFNKYHAWVNAEFLLEKCLVGILDEEK